MFEVTEFYFQVRGLIFDLVRGFWGDDQALCWKYTWQKQQWCNSDKTSKKHQSPSKSASNHVDEWKKRHSDVNSAMASSQLTSFRQPAQNCRGQHLPCAAKDTQ